MTEGLRGIDTGRAGSDDGNNQRLRDEGLSVSRHDPSIPNRWQDRAQTYVALELAALAALLHVLIFAFESIVWTCPDVYRRFGLTNDQDAQTTKPLAFNQSFYNLFLAAGAIIGVIMVLSESDLGWPLIIFCCASMLAASLVLVSAGAKYLRAAVTQGLLPLLALLSALIVRLM